MRLSTVIVVGMTQPLTPVSRDLVAAALHAHADAILAGLVPVPGYITLHAAGIAFPDFMALADKLGAPIRIVEPREDAVWVTYARLDLPFGGGLLPTSINADVMASTSIGEDAQRRADIDTHNAMCIHA